MKKQIIVIGLGQFGLGLVRSLSESNAEIIAVDSDEKRVNLASSWVNKAICFDATDEESIAQLRPETRDVCVCATGDQSKEVGIICTALFKQLGAKRIIARANDELHARILKLVGADEIVNPEWDFGARLAPHILHSNILGEMTLDHQVVITEILAPKNICGQTLRALNLTQRYGITVVAVKSKKTGTVRQVGNEDIIDTGDIMIIASSPEAVQRMVSLEEPQ